MCSQANPTFAVGDHEAFMEFALIQVQKSPPAAKTFCVGAVLADAANGKVLSTGYSLEYPRAEQCCLIKIADEHIIPEERILEVLPANTALYTTMEPCNERPSGNMTCATGTFVAHNDVQERKWCRGRIPC